MKIAVIVDSPSANDSRVRGQVEALRSCGHEVRVFAFVRHAGRPDSVALPSQLHGAPATAVAIDDTRLVPILSRTSHILRKARSHDAGSTEEKGQAPSGEGGAFNTVPASLPSALRQVLGAMFWGRATAGDLHGAVCGFAPDVLHANDLSTLGAAARVSRHLGCRLVYDAHEYEADRNGVPDSLAERVRLRDEKRFITHADAVVTVSDGIADRLAERYGIPRPHVVMNAFLTDVPGTVDLRAQLGLEAAAKLAILTGAAQMGRGHEEAIAALSHARPHWHLAILGKLSDARRRTLDDIARTHGVANRVHQLGEVEPDRVMSYARAADAALIPIQDTCEAYRVALPNKLFQAAFAHLPIVATPLPEIASWVRFADAGVVADGFAAVDLARALEDVEAFDLKPSIELDAYSAASQARRLCTIYAALESGRPLPVSTPLPHRSIGTHSGIALP